MGKGVYNPFMEMPKSCNDCIFWKGCKLVKAKLNMWDGEDTGVWLPANYRHEGCPLIEISEVVYEKKGKINE